ncbi:hypothetical protein [Thauera sp.]|uniref:hypothetical protein n=1 Tax=Thauera sp. TaxID=1905334 RepID=UPI0039E68A7D
MSIGLSPIGLAAIGASAASGGAPEPEDEFVTTAWPIIVEAAPIVVTPWLVAVQPVPVEQVVTTWPITVAAPAVTSAAWPVRVLPADVVGGLDGAAAWAAAPSGRWSALVTVGADDVSARLVGPVSVSVAADAARVAEIAWLPVAALAPLALVGQRVSIAFAEQGGSIQLLFSGVVDVPSVDLATGAISCRCTDQAQEIWSATSRTIIDGLVGGRWHPALGDPKDSFDYLGERIQSVGASWALDVRQQPRVLPWRSPARTLTVRTADTIDGSLSVDLPSRDQLRTRIVCRLQYRYPLLRYRGVQAQYRQSLAFFLPWYHNLTGDMLQGPRLWMTTPMVEGAAGSLPGFDLARLDIEHPSAGTYQTSRPSYSSIPKYESGMDGAYYIIRPDVAPALALGFSARYVARWQQSITHDYTVTVVWPELEAQLGPPVEEEIGASLDAEFDQPDWGRDPTVAPHLPDQLGVGDAAVAWQPDGATLADRDELLRALLDRAWVRLWSASRSGRVHFSLPCRPDLWLDTAIRLETERLRALGPIVEIEHVLDTGSGRAVSDITLAVGMPGNVPAPQPAWTLPAEPADGYRPPLSAWSCRIDTFVGGNAGAATFDDETMIGFSTNDEGSMSGVEYYPHQLRIQAPDLAAEDRDPRELTAATEIAVAIPTDLLEILP